MNEHDSPAGGEREIPRELRTQMTNSRGSQKPCLAPRSPSRRSRRSPNGTISPSTFISPRCFHGYFLGPGGTALNTTLAAFAIAYLLRPLAAIFGGLTPYVAQPLTERTGSTRVPGAMIAVVAVLVLPILATLPETAPTK
jgi:hypothetical protein